MHQLAICDCLVARKVVLVRAPWRQPEYQTRITDHTSREITCRPAFQTESRPSLGIPRKRFSSVTCSPASLARPLYLRSAGRTFFYGLRCIFYTSVQIIYLLCGRRAVSRLKAKPTGEDAFACWVAGLLRDCPVCDLYASTKRIRCQRILFLHKRTIRKHRRVILYQSANRRRYRARFL